MAKVFFHEGRKPSSSWRGQRPFQAWLMGGTSDAKAGGMKKTDKIFNGTVGRTAIQCIDPRSGKKGSWLYRGDNHLDATAIVSPLCADLYELFQWAQANGWKSVGGAYIYTP